MKVMKAMKKLKFWPRTKKKKKHPFPCPSSPPPPSRPPPPPPSWPPPPPPYNHLLHDNHSHYEPLLPSAPPLPQWLDYHLQFQEETALLSPPSSEIADDNATMTIISESHLSGGCPEFPAEADCISEQRLVVGNPVNHGDNGGVGCVVSLGAHLVRCVFPCFRVKEASQGESRRDLLF